MNPEAINYVIDNLASKLAVPAAKLMEVLPNLGFKTAVEFGLLVAFFGVWFIPNNLRNIGDKISSGSL